MKRLPLAARPFPECQGNFFCNHLVTAVTHSYHCLAPALKCLVFAYSKVWVRVRESQSTRSNMKILNFVEGKLAGPGCIHDNYVGYTECSERNFASSSVCHIKKDFSRFTEAYLPTEILGYVTYNSDDAQAGPHSAKHATLLEQKYALLTTAFTCEWKTKKEGSLLKPFEALQSRACLNAEIVSTPRSPLEQN